MGKKGRIFNALLLGLLISTQSLAYYPMSPSPWGSGWGGFPSPYNYYGYYPGSQFGSPFPGAYGFGQPRHFFYQRPWGRINGMLAPDGSFWVNITIGGHYNDFQSLISAMQYSARLQSGQSHSQLRQGAMSDALWQM